MDEPKKLILFGMVSGLALKDGVNELTLAKASIFRNPAAIKESGSPPELGANTHLYSGEGENRHPAGEVATYLIESEKEIPGGTLGHTNIKGSGGVTFDRKTGGITLSTGTEPYSGASVAIPLGSTFNTRALMQTVFEDAILPIRLLTKARILVFPVGVLAKERREELLQSGLNITCPELVGASLVVELSADDCGKIREFSHKLSQLDLAYFQVPIDLFRSSFYEPRFEYRALDLIIALESLLSESSESITYKLAFRGSCLLAGDDDRLGQFHFIKKAYDYRSILVHGRKRKRGKDLSELSRDIDEIEDLIRKLLKVAFILEFDPVRLQSGKKASMRTEKSIDEYILTHLLAKKKANPGDSFSEVGKLRRLNVLI